MPRRVLFRSESLANPCRGFGLPCMWLYFEEHGVEVRGAAVERDGRQRGQACCEARQMTGTGEREARETRHDRRALHQREPFFRRERERCVAKFGPDAAGIA